VCCSCRLLSEHLRQHLAHLFVSRLHVAGKLRLFVSTNLGDERAFIVAFLKNFVIPAIILMLGSFFDILCTIFFKITLPIVLLLMMGLCLLLTHRGNILLLAPAIVKRLGDPKRVTSDLSLRSAVARTLRLRLRAPRS
jgi:hypothetical protein